METHKAKRVEIIIEAPMERRLTAALIEHGVTGFTVLPVRGGSGRSGNWSRAGQISSAGGMVAVVCLMKPERVETLLEGVFPLVERHVGVISISDCEVMRAERF